MVRISKIVIGWKSEERGISVYSLWGLAASCREPSLKEQNSVLRKYREREYNSKAKDSRRIANRIDA